MERQHAGDPAEEAGPVGRDDGEPVAVAAQHLLARPQQLEVLGGREVVAHLVDGAAAQHVGGAGHEVADEVGLPRAPGRRTGGLAVGLGERGEQPEGAQVADGLGHRLDGGGVVEVAAGGDVGQQQVVAHHRLTSTSTSAGGEPHAGADGARRSSMPTSVWSPG